MFSSFEPGTLLAKVQQNSYFSLAIYDMNLRRMGQMEGFDAYGRITGMKPF
jgi:hypothetical protein